MAWPLFQQVEKQLIHQILGLKVHIHPLLVVVQFQILIREDGQEVLAKVRHCIHGAAQDLLEELKQNQDLLLPLGVCAVAQGVRVSPHQDPVVEQHHVFEAIEGGGVGKGQVFVLYSQVVLIGASRSGWVFLNNRVKESEVMVIELGDPMVMIVQQVSAV